jgi:hypothetical protein
MILKARLASRVLAIEFSQTTILAQRIKSSVLLNHFSVLPRPP